MGRSKKQIRVRIIQIAMVVLALIVLWKTLVFFFFDEYVEFMTKKTAQQYLQQQYGDKDFEVVDVNYQRAFLSPPELTVSVRSKSNPKIAFVLKMRDHNKVNQDGYQIQQRERVAKELVEEYEGLVRAALSAKDFIFEIRKIRVDFDFPDTDNSDRITSMEELWPNEGFDLRTIGAERGQVIVYLSSEQWSLARIATIFLEIKKQLDESHLPFTSIVLRRETLPGEASDNLIPNDFRMTYAQIHEEEIMEYLRKEVQVWQP